MNPWCFDMEQQTDPTEELTIPAVPTVQDDQGDQGVQEVEEVQEVAKPSQNSQVMKDHRFSALVNGFCMGAGFVLFVAGTIMPFLMPQQLVTGLSLVISAISCVSLGMILEVYQLAKLK